MAYSGLTGARAHAPGRHAIITGPTRPPAVPRRSIIFEFAEHGAPLRRWLLTERPAASVSQCGKEPNLGTFKEDTPMRRHRNARYAPESLERKLSPSAVGVAPPVQVDTVVMAPPATDCAGPALTSSIIADGSAGNGFDMTGYSVDYTTTYGDPSGDLAPAWSAPGSDILLTDNGGDVPPLPGDGPPPTDLPPYIPIGPGLPA